MPIWFFDKETETPQIYGSYEAVSKNEGIDIKILHNHFSLPYNIEPLRKLKVIEKRILNPDSSFKPKYLEYVFAINRLVNDASIYEIEKLVRSKYSVPINNSTNVRVEKMNFVFTRKENEGLDTSKSNHLFFFKNDFTTIQNTSIVDGLNRSIFEEFVIELDKHTKKYKYTDGGLYECNLLHIPDEELVNILTEEILPVITQLIKDYDKKYHTSYVDERYELHKLDIIRA